MLLTYFITFNILLFNFLNFNTITCDVTPLASASQGRWPDRGGKCSGWSSQKGSDFTHYYLYILLF